MRVPSLMNLASHWNAYLSYRRPPGGHLASAQPGSSLFDSPSIITSMDKEESTATSAANTMGNFVGEPDRAQSTTSPVQRGQLAENAQSQAPNAVSRPQSHHQRQTSAGLPISTPDRNHAPRPCQTPIRNPKNESRLTKIGQKGFIVTKASKCGHEFHPGGGRPTHEPECPPCKMEALCMDLKKIQDDFGNRGGIIESKNGGLKRSASEFEDENPESQYLAETMTGKIPKHTEHGAHDRLLRGWGSKSDLRRKRAIDSDPEAVGWRRAKTKLHNFVVQCEEKVDEEDCWEWRFMKWNQGSGFPGTNSHRDALEIYEEQKEDLQYVYGDPAGNDNRAYEAALARRDSTIPAQLEMPATKKRRIGSYARVRFNDTLTVATHCDIDVRRTGIRSRLFRANPKELETSTRPLRLPEEARPRKACLRRPIKTVNGQKTLVPNKSYSPGLWSSPEGYEKAETSWMHETDEQRERDSLDHEMTLLDSCKAVAGGIQAAMALPM